MRPSTAGRVWHALTAALVGVAVVIQLVLSASGASVLVPGAPPPVGIRIWQFFSYFTIQANLLVVLGLVPLARDLATDGARWRVLRFAGLIGITVTGLVYATLLRPLVHLEGLLWWLDLMLHTISPIMVILGWLVWGPRPRVNIRVIGWVLLWPLVWLAYTLVVGGLRGWYPYPFLDPRRSGWPLVVTACAGITVLFVVLALIFRGIDRRWPSAAPGGRAR